MRILMIILLSVSISEAAAITQAQVDTIVKTCSQSEIIIKKMNRLATATGLAISSSNTYRLDGSTQSYSFDATKQQDTVNYYQDLKAQLQVQFNALP